MGKFEKALLASDLDGTLFNDKKEISRENLEALRYFTDNGGVFIAATGRARKALEAYAPQLPLNGHSSVLLNGALVYNFAQKNTVRQHTMPAVSAKMVRELFERYPNVALEVFAEDTVYVCHPNATTAYHFDTIRIPYTTAEPAYLPPPSDWFKVNVTGSVADLAEAKAYLKQYRESLMMVSSIPIFYELTALAANKGDAVRFVAEEYPERQIYAIGDNFNDVPMLETADVSFAPANAEEKVKQVADVLVSSNNEASVRDVIFYIEQKI